jgi:hypothetical protein
VRQFADDHAVATATALVVDGAGVLALESEPMDPRL